MYDAEIYRNGKISIFPRRKTLAKLAEYLVRSRRHFANIAETDTITVFKGRGVHGNYNLIGDKLVRQPNQRPWLPL